VAWGRAPAAGTARIEQRRAVAWVVLATARVSAGSVFARGLGASGCGTFRAVVGSDASLTWRT